MITVQLPDGRRVKVNTTDPKAAAEAAKKFLAKPPAEPTAMEKAGSVASAVGSRAASAAGAVLDATPSLLKYAGRTARDAAIEAFTPLQSSAEAVGLPQIGQEQMLKNVSGRTTGPIQEGLTNLGQDFRERPLETGLSVAAGFTPLGKAAGAVAATGRMLGRVTLGTTGALAGAEGDKELFKATGGLIGREGESGDPTVLQAAAVQIFGEAAGVALKLASPAIARTQLSTAKTKLAKLEASRGATESQKEQARRVVSKLENLAAQSKEKVLKQAAAEGSLYEKNGQNIREAMKTLSGSEKAADKLLYADELYDAGVASNLKQPFFIGYAAQVNRKQRELTKTIDAALAPKGIGPSSKQGYTDMLRTKAAKAQEQFSKEAAAAERAVFTPTNAPTPILGSELLRALNDPEVVAPMVAEGYGRKLEAMRQAVGKSTALTTSDLAKFMGTVQEQFVTLDDTKARTIFYSQAFPRLQSLFKDVASRPSGVAAKSYANAALDYFDRRFKLANLSDETLTKAIEGNPEAAFNILRSPAALESFTRAAKDSLGLQPNEVQRYIQTLVRDSLKGTDGHYNTALVSRLFESMDKTVAKSVLGDDFFTKLTSLDTVLNGIDARGVRQRIASLGTSEMMATGNRADQAIQNIALGAATGQPLQQGAGQAQLGRSALGMLMPLNLDKASFDYVASAAEQNLPAREVFVTLGRLAVEAGKPLAFGYETFQERYQAIQAERDKLKAKMGGQGGPEEVAPSMSDDERRYNILMNGGTLDEAQQLREQRQLQDLMDDQDLLVKQQLKEDSKLVSKLSTRQEEGFRTRVYKDSKGFKTVGIGFNMEAAGARQIWRDAGVKTGFDDVLAGRKEISKGEAEALYSATKKSSQAGAARLVKNYAKLGVHQQAALADMVFQLGQVGAQKFVRTRALIEAGKFAEAAAAMMASENARQTPNRVLRRAYMLQHNVSLAEADAALVKAGKISAKESINTPQELSRLMQDVKVAAVPQPMATPAKRKRPTYAQAKANKGIA